MIAQNLVVSGNNIYIYIIYYIIGFDPSPNIIGDYSDVGIFGDVGINMVIFLWGFDSY